ncbi:MAG: phosphoribosyltransferase family protein [Candidatus Pacebacteria bacterium]|nr:phosphoribosyltransferase family protein [Candidatus Paceibacterota bacterium]
MGFLNTILDSILDIVFPTKCIFCGKKNADLCRECLIDIPNAERESAKWIFPLYDYRNPIIKKSLWMLKYNGKRRLAKIFAAQIYENMMEELSELAILENFHDIIIIPIPLSNKRYRERGFNQAQLICEELIKINGSRKALAFKLENNILIKPKETEHQARIKDRNLRLKNIIGSFAIKNTEATELIKNKNIILIDDVTTTGATLAEAKKILRQSGARKVIAFTVAH